MDGGVRPLCVYVCVCVWCGVLARSPKIIRVGWLEMSSTLQNPQFILTFHFLKIQVAFKCFGGPKQTLCDHDLRRSVKASCCQEA